MALLVWGVVLTRICLDVVEKLRPVEDVDWVRQAVVRGPLCRKVVKKHRKVASKR